MGSQSVERTRYGAYEGVLGRDYVCPDLAAWLGSLKCFVYDSGATVLSEGRHRNVLLETACHGKPLRLVVKAFGRQSVAADAIARCRGSKAERTWKAASRLAAAGVGTPCPIGFLERWEGGRLLESYFLSEYCADMTSFKQELVGLFRFDPECSRFMALLQTVATALRAMHDAGFVHLDLGNQNILLRRRGRDDWGDVVVIDLNRGRFCDRLSHGQRGRDLSRLSLPSDLLRVFLEMYWAPEVPPENFLRAERWARKRYAWHSATRALRHPIREANKRAELESATYPHEKDLWIWDERSGQSIPPLRSRDRHRYYARGRNLTQAWAVMRHACAVWREFRKLKRHSFTESLSMKGRVSVAISARPERVAREQSLLEELGHPPVHIRFYHHETEKEWRHAIGVVEGLKRQGYAVSIALVQDRRAMMEPDTWKHFVDMVVDRVGGCVEWIEVGHAINRVKWGIWGFREYRRMLEPIAAHAASQPDLRFVGPACIDFEYPFLLAALRRVPTDLRFAALSHHLYVDRRGAPENKQGIFGTVEKSLLARAVARCFSSVCEDRFIVSEVNWPLRGTGVYSPVGSPYESPGPRSDDPSVSEDAYGNYMLRYILMVLCCGAAEQVVWWQLVAHGYGLVDDLSEAWRQRPAFYMLKTFLELMRDAEFLHRAVVPLDATGGSGGEFLLFKKSDQTVFSVAYALSDEAVQCDAPFEFGAILDAFGQPRERDASGCSVRVSGRPVYLIGVEMPSASS